MLQRLNKRVEKARNQEGFTLIELLLVIVILGVLAGIVVFSVSGINDKSASAACKTDVSTVQTAEEAYYAINHAYAATPDALKAAGLLKTTPPVAEGISIDGTGNVTANPACPA
jgi:prepilin-type N-terminal cleavage/methylation domain-containing protein